MINGWDTAISDAEKMIAEERQRIARLKRAIEAFKDLRDSGHRFPENIVNEASDESLTQGEDSRATDKDYKREEAMSILEEQFKQWCETKLIEDGSPLLALAWESAYAAGAAAEREWLLALAQQWTARTCAADGQPCEHQRVAQELISRIRQRAEEGK